jgi:NAD(P)H-flavin reductase
MISSTPPIQSTEPSLSATAAADPMLPRPYRVKRVAREIAGTFTMALEPADGGDIPPFTPGQFNMLYVFGVGEIPISISGDPTRRTPLVHTTRSVGPVSRAVCALEPGDLIGVRGPFGNCWPVEQAAGRDVVLVAGGIGLAPLRPAMYHMLAHRDQYRQVVLLYGARIPTDMLYRRELERWRSRFDLDVYVTVDRGSASWRGNVGVVTRLIPRSPFDPANAVALVCGPEIMMRFTTAELMKRGMAAEQIFVSLERNMKCAIGQCGHCQLGPLFVCKDGPVFAYSRVRDLIARQEI